MDRRVGGQMSGDHLGRGRGNGIELDRIRPYEPGDDVRKIDWNATARTLVAARPRGRAGAAADGLAPARPLPVDALRHGRPPQGRRRRGRGARRRSVRRPARQSPRHRHLRRRRGDQVMPPAGGRRGMLGLIRALETEPAEEGDGPTSPARALALVGATRSTPGRRRRRLGLPRSARLGPGPDRRRRPPRGHRPRDHRPARGRARRRRRADPHRPRDRPDAPRRHRRPPAADRVRRGRRRGSRRRSRGTFRRLGIRHLRLSTDGPWLPALARGLRPEPGPNRTTRMNFLAPELLLGLLLIPIAIGFYLWAQRRRSKYAVRFTNLDLLANLAPRRPSWRRHLPPVLYLGAIAALLIGLARPTMVMAVPREDATVILTMDVSGSMRATDVDPTRLDAATRRRPVVHRPAARQGPRRDRRVRLGARHARLADDRPRAAQGRARQPPPADGTAMGDALMQVLDIAEQIQADATAPDASAAPSASPAPSRARRPSASPGTAVGPADVPSGQPLVAAILLSDGANSVGQAEPLDAAERAAIAGRADLHDRPRDARTGPSRSATTSDGSRPSPVPPDTETLEQIARYDRRQGVRRADRAGPRQRLRQPPVADRLHRGDARKSRSPSSAPGSCWSSSARASRRSGSAGFRSARLVRGATALELSDVVRRRRRHGPSSARPLAGRVPSGRPRPDPRRPDARLRCRRAPHRVPGPRARAGRPAGRLPRWPGRHAGPAAGDRRGGRLLPRHERQLGRRVRDQRGVATRWPPRRTRAVADFLGAGVARTRSSSATTCRR